jgi:hypothetical protein
MRRWAVLLLVAGVAWPAWAAKTISVQQLEDLLASLHDKPDGKVAQQLSDLQVTERISFVRLARWEKEFPGDRTREELTKLADLSAFLNPPAMDVLRDPEPDTDTQEHMLSLAVNYAKTTLRQLPNFYATRETTHFEDTPSQQQASSGGGGGGTGWRATHTGEMEVSRTAYKAIHSTGTTSVTVAYRDGYEVRDEGAKTAKPSTPPGGLSTSGEFGPVLSIVLGDALRGDVTWLRWEQGTIDPVAVIGYRIPEDQSNYLVMIPKGTELERIYSAYHGEIAIDPEAGEILRVSVVADLPPPHETLQTAMLVEYGPVMIGDRSYICPVRGVAYSKVPVQRASSEPPAPGVMVLTQINDVVFTNYHLFRADARIVGGDDARNPPAGASAPATPDPEAAPVGAASKPN